jgi:hypothetical protein
MLLTLHQMLCFHKLRKMMFFILSISIFIFFPTKINYDIHGKTFLTIVHVFEDWYHLLAKVQYETIIYFEQIYIYIYICFMTTCVLNQHQDQLALSLFQFWFVITSYLKH